MKPAALLLALAALAACDRLDYYRETYTDGNMARGFGAIDRGVVPAFVPDEARNIITAQNHRTGARWMRCELPESAIAQVSAAVERVGWAQAHEHIEPPPPWLGQWHPFFDRTLTYTPDGSSTYWVYHDKAGEWHGVIAMPSRTCFAYRLPLH